MNKILSPQKSGVALVMVLASLVFLSVLIVAFLFSSKTALRTSKSSADSSKVRLLGETCLNIVLGQIRDATSGGTSICWASQPGMIRTYDDSARPLHSFKLFSSDALRVSGLYNPSTDTPSATWSDERAIYVDLNEPVRVGTTDNYPILDPDAARAGSSAKVEGIRITGAPVRTPNEAPMPVRWLYVLQDGTLAPAVPAGTPSGMAAKVTGASNGNPIVARIAFWTDDETAKVNLNTASEGTFWDTPRCEGTTERNFGSYQPATNEFQRYPGHPATVSLKTVFPQLTADQIYDIIPRITKGGSLGGTAQATGTIAVDKDRLYASIDELVFAPSRVENNPTAIQRRSLENGRFFITTASRAPEVNLFNKPRVTIWPVHADLMNDPNSRYTRPVDRLIAFSSTMRTDLGRDQAYRYYFQRKNPDSPTEDINLPRNRELYSYLQELTSKKIPGFGGPAGGFADNTKYGADRDQILTEIFDYVRCANLSDGKLAPECRYASARNTGVPRFDTTIPTGSGLVCPSYLSGNQTRGFGRFPTISKVALWFIATNDASQVPPGTTEPPLPSSGHVRVQAALMFDLFDPSLGWTALQTGFTIRVNGLQDFAWNSENMGFTPGDLVVNQAPGQIYYNSNYGGRIGFALAALGREARSDFMYPFLSAKRDFPLNQPFSVSSAKLNLEILFHGTIVQTINIDCPGFSVPSPPTVFKRRRLAREGDQYANTFLERFIGTGDPVTFNGGRYDGYFYWIRPEDRVRSFQCDSGDCRLIAGSKDVSESLFKPHPENNSSYPYAHSLYAAGRWGYYGASKGRLVPGVSYDSLPREHKMSDFTPQPDVPASNGVFIGGQGTPPGSSGTVPGDWDNSFARVPDGPYINKVDEGTINGAVPYFDSSESWTDASPTFFSPNRQIPSAGMFGSLPTGVKGDKPWQTLLFRPRPLNHPGLIAPADHLLLDLFTMPVVEPYAISEPFSTSGKINLNCQIVPFTYIERETGLRALLKSQQILAIPNSAGTVYKTDMNAPSYRYSLNLDETMNGFRERFATNDIFRSASEVCSLHLVPNLSGATWTKMNDRTKEFWEDYGLTGDNSRERPYTNIYPLVTTKSNTWTVHCRVQTLQKSRQRNNLAPDEFDERKGDQVTAEYRGSTLFERYIDPNDRNLPDFVTAPGESIDSHYRFRVLETKQFNP